MSPRSEVLRLEHVVGKNLERIRAEQGLSQDDVASRGWFVGLPWSRSTVAALEAGKRNIALGEVVLLALTVGVSVAELLAGSGQAILGDEARVSLPEIRGILSNEYGPGEAFEEVTRHIFATRKQHFDHVMLSANGEAEQKAARKLGITPQIVAEAAWALWRRSLTDERNSQVEEFTTPGDSPRRIQAFRGHVTRQLLDEIENRVSSNPDIYVKLDEED